MSFKSFFWSFVFFISSASVFASNGNINVNMTRIDDGFSTTTLIILGLLILLVLVVSVIVLLRRRNQYASSVVNTVSLKEDTPHSAVSNYEKVFKKSTPEIIDEKAPAGTSFNLHLKEDERIVVNVLRMKHNVCSQATIRVVTDFSKARLSRTIAELEERGIIFKERKGRKNMITLRD